MINIINKLEKGVTAMIHADNKTNDNIGFMNVGPFLTKLSLPKPINLRIAEKGILMESRQDTDRIPWENIVRVYTETGFIKQSGVFIEMVNGAKLRIYNIKSGIFNTLKDKDVADILNSKATGKIEEGWANANEIINKTKEDINKYEKLANTNFGPSVQECMESTIKSGWTMDGTKLTDDQIENLKKQLNNEENLLEKCCYYCGTNNKSISKFCYNCGKALE